MKRYALGVLLLALSGVMAAAMPAGAAPAPRHSQVQLTPAHNDALTRALKTGRLTKAEYSLQRAKTLFRLDEVRDRFGAVARPDPEEATFLLRDLALTKTGLSGQARRQARSLLARPTDGSADPLALGYRTSEAPPVCSTNLCIHYVTSTSDAPDPTDNNGNGVPDYVDAAKNVFQNEVWATEIGAYGYRPPKSDSSSPNNGGNGKIDIYLADVGADGLYGLCTSDDPNLENPSYPYFDASAYCVVDDDFAADQYGGTATGIRALQVTAAHEFFHAIQFAYDISEDVWFMENTATWVEDEVYDDINDNYQYLLASALSNPAKPLDYGADFFQYGNWIFFRFLSEHFGSSSVHDPSIVRQAWEQADSAPGGPDRYSLEAVRKAIGSRGESIADVFAHFGAANFKPQSFYEEGTSYAGVVGPPPVSGSFVLGSSSTNTGTVTKRLDHLSNRFFELKPGSGVSDGARLRVVVDGPRASTAPRATLVVVKTSGTVRKNLVLDAAGDGRTSVSFSKASVKKVVLVLTNASTRYNCWVNADSPFSCRGFSRDDGRTFSFIARLLQ